jgi:hypothetical protein
MILQNEVLQNQSPMIAQPTPTIQSNPQIPSPTPTRKPIFIYLIGLFVFILILFISWAGYQIYQYKKTPNQPNLNRGNTYTTAPTPPVSVILPPDTPPKGPEYTGVYVCIDNGCAIYPPQDAKQFCPMTFKTSNCDNKCGDPANRCKQ